jgi:hypothetical protein
MLICPHCQGTVTPLPLLTFVSLTDFFVCDACARVLERPKGATGQPIAVSTRVMPSLEASV